MMQSSHSFTSPLNTINNPFNRSKPVLDSGYLLATQNSNQSMNAKLKQTMRFGGGGSDMHPNSSYNENLSGPLLSKEMKKLRLRISDYN